MRQQNIQKGGKYIPFWMLFLLLIIKFQNQVRMDFLVCLEFGQVGERAAGVLPLLTKQSHFITAPQHVDDTVIKVLLPTGTAGL